MQRPKQLILTFLTFSICILITLLFESCYDEPTILQGKADQLSYFTFTNNRVYALNHDKLQVYTVENGTFTYATTLTVDPYNESVFSNNAMLFLLTTGSSIYDISNPDQPEYISNYQNLYSCDAVAFKDHYLFSSVSISSDCRVEGINQIQVIDLNLPVPSLVKSYSIETPQGISIDGNTLFVSGGDSGLSILNIEDPLNISLVKKYADIKGVDVSAQSGLILVTNSSGIAQYDYSDLNDLKLLSIIPIP